MFVFYVKIFICACVCAHGVQVQLSGARKNPCVRVHVETREKPRVFFLMFWRAWVCLCVFKCTYMHMHVEAISQSWMSFFWSYLPCLLNTGSLADTCSSWLGWAGWMAGCRDLPVLTSQHGHHTQLFMCVLETILRCSWVHGVYLLPFLSQAAARKFPLPFSSCSEYSSS